MTNVLVIKAHPLNSQQSRTLTVLEAFLETYRQQHATANIEINDLYQSQFPEIDADVLGAWPDLRAGNTPEQLPTHQRDKITVFNTAVQQFIAADKVIIANPLWNMSIPTKLKSWIDAINVAGKTFKYNADGSATPLAPGKKIVHIQATGGKYAGQDFGTQYIQMMLKFLGATSITKIGVEGMDHFPDQALSVGIIMPFMQNIMILIFPAEKRGMAMGLTGIVIALAPALGPTLSGWIVDQFSWRDLFGIMVPITIAVILLTMVGMRKLIVLTHPRIDILSIIESSVGFGALLYALATISGGHWFIIGVTLLIGIIGIVLFVRRQLAMDDPMLNLHVFQSPMFTLTTVLSSLSNMALLGMQLLVPLYLQSVFQIPVLTADLVMIPGALMMAIVNPIAGMIFDRSGIEKMSLVGFTIFTLATIPFVIMTPTWSLITVTLLYAIWMAGISLIVMQLGTAGINALPSELVAHGNGVNTMARQIGASIGTALLITISTLGSQMSHATTTVASSLFGYRLAFLALVILSLLGLIGTF